MGAPTPQVGVILQILCRKLHENERIFNPRGGGASLPPPWICRCRFLQMKEIKPRGCAPRRPLLDPPMADPRDVRPLGVQILSFSCSFRPKICTLTPTWELVPPLQEYPGSTTGQLSKSTNRWILYCRVRVWVQYLSFAGYHRPLPYRRWPTQFHSIYIYSVYIYVLFISKRVWGHYGELISVKIQ